MNVNKELKHKRKDQSELKNITETVKNTLEGINRSDDTEEQIIHLTDRIVEIIQSEQQEKKKKKNIEGTTGTIASILTFELHVSQKEAKDRKGKKIYWKKWLKTSLTWERKQILRFTKHRDNKQDL